jgi:BirA family transcriptional regulator, biotin operon repressor / biotin---[acetyl-CoA-carboxylase] ligase
LPSGSPDSRPFLGRVAHLDRVGSTNDVVREWLAEGAPEICLATADEQTAGRGRSGRTWQAPAGSSVLLSLGFRPTWLAPDRTWRLAAIAALAMADATTEVAGLTSHSVLLKWPNDLVVEDGGPDDPRAGTLRKLGGVLGETDGLGTTDPRAIVGLGVDAGWPAADFPPDLAPSMTSLDELSGGRPIDRGELVERFIARLRPLVESLRAGSFDGAAWAARQVTTGRDVRLETADGDTVTAALGVDPESGALLVADPAAAARTRSVLSGEVVHVRLPGRPIEPAPTGSV